MCLRTRVTCCAGTCDRPGRPEQLFRRENRAEVVADRLLELGVGAGAGITVRAPAGELGGVPETPPLHVVVADLDHPFRPQRDEREVLARIPPAGLAVPGGGRGPRALGRALGPAPL